LAIQQLVCWKLENSWAIAISVMVLFKHSDGLTTSKKAADLSASVFWFGIASILLVSLFLRFWGLERFNTLVFDEVYYAKFANNYLTRTPFFDGHPPLSKYIIAIGIWLGMRLPFGHDTVNGLAGSPLTTWSYRWLNALVGSFIPLVIASLAYQISHRRSYALIACLFSAVDGLFLVESRYALNNVYLVILGLLGQVFFLLSLNFAGHSKTASTLRTAQFYACLLASGLFFGASASIKWNGLWFLFGAYLVWGAGWVIHWLERFRLNAASVNSGGNSSGMQASESAYPLKRLTCINVLHVLFFWAIVPFAFYWVQWIPHLQLNPGAEFWDLQRQILVYHEQVGNGSDIHPYCSNWYTWLLMIRPVAYFYERARSISDPVPSGGPAIPAGTETVIYDVHAMGNPFLWWLSTLAIVLLLLMLIEHLQTWFASSSSRVPSESATAAIPLQTTGFWIGLYLLLNYTANLLPWVRVTRCTFLYHYMGASVFALLAIAALVDHWLSSPQPKLRRMGTFIIGLIVIGFLFWLPVYLGLPLSPAQFRLRMWFPTWI
jgi:dolichyl-phosphate-mannose-protein mannosyltransferase